MNTITFRRFGTIAISIGLAATGAMPSLYGASEPNQPQQKPSSAIQTEQQAAQLKPEELQFFQKSADANINGIALGYLAIEKGASDTIKDLGRKMVDSNAKANKDLMDLANRKKVFIQISQLRPNEQEVASLSKVGGADFDKQFLKTNYAVHNQDKNELQQFLGKVSDSDLRKYAQDQLDAVNDRLSDMEDKASDIGLTAQQLRAVPPVGEAPQGQQPQQQPPQNQSPGQPK